MPDRLLLRMLPGMDGTAHLFAPIAPLLSAHYDLTCATYAGEAASGYAALHRRWTELDAPDNELDGNALRDREYVLLAESYSTPLAIMVAATKPPNLRALVLCAGFASSPVCNWKRLLVKLLAPLVFRTPLPASAIRAFLLDASSSPSLVRQVQDAIASVRASTLLHRLRDVLTVDVEDLLEQVSVPTLWIVPTRDRLIPARNLDRLRRQHPNMHVLEIAGPHLLLQRRPKECSEAIRAFVSSFPSSPEVTRSTP